MANISDGKLYVNIITSNNKRRKSDITELLNLQETTAVQIANSLESYSSKYQTINEGKALCQVLRQMGTFARNAEVDFTSSDETYKFFINFRAHWYTTLNINKDLSSRNQAWVRFLKFVRSLIKKRVLPDFSIPLGNSKLENRDVFERKKIIINNSAEP